MIDKKTSAIRVIVDRETGRASLFVVIGKQTESPFWIGPDRLKQLSELDENVVIDMSSVNRDGEVQKDKAAVRIGNTLHFLIDSEPVGSMSVTAADTFFELLTQPEPTLRQADDAKAADILKKVRLATTRQAPAQGGQ